ISRLHQRFKLVHKLIVSLLLFHREIKPFDPGFILHLVKRGLRITLPENLIANPAEGPEVLRRPSSFHHFYCRRQARSLAVFFRTLSPPSFIERFVLTNRDKSRWAGKDFA